MKPLFVRPSRSTWIALSAASVVLSVSVYIAFAIAIGDPTGFAGTTHGDSALRIYYPVALALCAGALAAICPETAPLTATLFAVSQVLSCLVIGVTEVHGAAEMEMFVLIVPFVLFAILPWVGVGAALGAGARFAARAIIG